MPYPFAKASLLFLSLSILGCGIFTQNPPVVRTEAALGKIIIYRNGVAYVERRARFSGDNLTLSVPAERVDDFLKSLTVVDAKTGKTLPVSFPTVDKSEGTVELKIQLPKEAPQDLLISYVTESPAWKPSYRVILGNHSRGKLQAWAIVDNVSGEKWEKVTIGVGSTSALSFKYDLHSIRLVQRETLASDDLVAQAPPTGGPLYQVSGQEMKVVGNIRLDELEQLAVNQNAAPSVPNNAHAGIEGETRAGDKPAEKKGGRAYRQYGPAQAQIQQAPSNLSRVASSLRSTTSRVRVEGYAKKEDQNPYESSLNRANVVRDQLVANGVPATQIDVVATAQVSSTDGARMVMIDGEPKPTQSPSTTPSSSPAESEPIGNALFITSTAMNLDDGQSAMVSLITADTDAKQVYYYDPLSARGSKRFAFKAIRLVNPSSYTLESGPFTVYAGGQFLGEGLSEPIPPKSEAFIPFGLDRELLADPTSTTREEIDKLVTIQRGIVTTEARFIRQTKVTFHNRGSSPAEVYVRHAVPSGWKLEADPSQYKKLGSSFIFPVTVKPKQAMELVIDESTPVTRSLDLSSDPGVKAIGLYLKTAKLDPAIQDRLKDIVKLHSEIQDGQERINTIESQMAVYRVRIDEIHVQLVTLRKVATAQQLSRHLAQKMEEISNRLQTATVEVTDLKGQLMTKRIAVQDKLAELTLTTKVAN